LEIGKVKITLAMSPGFSGERQQEGAAGAVDGKIKINYAPAFWERIDFELFFKKIFSKSFP
jgi:hypothetical protein